MKHPITRIGQFESLRGKYISYTTNGGRTWSYAKVLDQPRKRHGNKLGYEAACEVRGTSTRHQFFLFTAEVLSDPSCIVQSVSRRDTLGKQFARSEGKPRRQARRPGPKISMDGGRTWIELR